MSKTRTSTLFLVVLALAFWASTASAQTLTATPSAINLGNYTIGTETPLSATFTVTAAPSTVYTATTANFWFSVTCGTYTATTNGDTCTVTGTTDVDTLAGGAATGSISLSTGGSDLTTVGVSLFVNPLVPAASTVSLTYVKTGGAGQPAASQSIAVSDGDNALSPYSYTVAPAGTCPAWLLESSGHAWTATPSQPDSLTFSVDSTSTVVNGMDAGSGSCIVNLVYSATNVWPFTVNWTVNNPGGRGTSPLSLAVTGPIALSYVRYGGAQTTATSTAVIDSVDSTPEALTATFTGTQPPAWLTAVPVSGHTSASSGSPGQVAFTIAVGSTGADTATPGTFGPYTVNIVAASQPALQVTVNVTISAQGLSFATAAVLSYTTGTSAASVTASPMVKSSGGSVAFTTDAATVPWWLNSPAGGTATAAGTTVSIQGNPAVLTGMSVGNYSATVKFLPATTPANSLPEFSLTVNLTVSSTAATISLGTTPAAVILQPGATTPAPTVSPTSSVGDVGFTIACAATTTYTAYTPIGTGCTLKNGSNPAAASITGIAYTWGTPLAVTIDSGLFSPSTPYGTQVLVTVTVTATTNSSTAAPLVFTYNFQPVPATITSISPAATAAAGTSPVNVVISGANFVPASAIVGSLASTEVFLSTTATTAGVVSAWNQVMANVTVVSPTAIVVTIPAASLPTFTASATVTTAKLYIGVANQVGLSAPSTSSTGFKPDAYTSLDVTTNPVIQAITSTASYVQPNPGNMPNVAPYDLVSIFGANFGATSATIATPDTTYHKYPTSLTVGTSGTGTAAKNIVLQVTFTGTATVAGKATATTYSAPILFANANQINVAVPSGLNTGTVQVAVSSGTTATPPASDKFPVNYVAADPGIFTLTSEGTGQGAIVNTSTGVVNGTGNGAQQGVETIAIYMTGLGIPNSTAADTTNTGSVTYPGSCASVSSYLTLVNTSVTTGTKYTAPSPLWTSLDGALMTRVASGLFPPCMLNTVGSSAIVTVSFNGGPVQPVAYAGFVSGSVAGLYQVNVAVPAGLTTVDAGPVTIPLTVTVGTLTSPPVNVVIAP